jgi:hypothetical protein
MGQKRVYFKPLGIKEVYRQAAIEERKAKKLAEELKEKGIGLETTEKEGTEASA